MARVTKINVGGTNYDIAHEGELKNSGFEVVTSLPTTGLFVGREVMYNGQLYVYNSSQWVNVNAPYEAKLKWGGDNFSDGCSPIDASMIPSLGANRSAYMPAECIDVEYSRDGGETWVEYPLSDLDKSKLFSVGGLVTIGNYKQDNTPPTSLYQTRITLKAKTYLYSHLHKFYIRHSVNGSYGAKLSLSAAKSNSTEFELIGSTRLNSFPGNAILNTPSILVGNTATCYDRLRFLLTIEGSEPTRGLQLYLIGCYGGQGWYTPSGLAKRGTIYSLGAEQEVTFPNSVISQETVNFDVNNIEPTQTGNVSKTSTWLWQYLVQAVNWLKANNVRLSSYNTKVAALEQADSDNNASTQSVRTDLTELSNGLATVATSGSYNDLTDKPALYEANLRWGGRNISDSYSPIDGAMVSELSANVMAHPNPAGISVEYSRDGGDTWLDYEATDEQKVNLFTLSTSLVCGKSAPDGLLATVGYQLRITITPVDCGLYTMLNKIIMNISINGGGNCWCTFKGLKTKYVAAGNEDDTYYDTIVNKAEISGWPGYNVINFSNIQTANSLTDTTHADLYYRLRLIFGYDTVDTPSYSGLVIFSLRFFGPGRFRLPSNLARNNHLYTYDWKQNALFPAKVRSNEIINFDVNNIEPTQTGNNISKTSTWLWQYLVQAVNWLKANNVRLSAYNTKIAALEQADSDNNASIQSVNTDLTELSNGLATVATSGSYNDLTDKPTLFSGSYDDLTNKPTLATVATSGNYDDLLNTPALVFQNIGGTISSVQIPDGLIANAKLANSSMTLNDTTVNLGDTAILPWYVDYNETDYPARIREHWLQIYRNGVWANLMYLGDILPTQVGQITSLDNLDWYNEQVSEYEVDSNTTTSILNGTTKPAALLLNCSAEQLTLNLFPISGKTYGKGSLDSLITDLQGKGFSVFVENDLDAILSSGSDYLVRIKISKVPTPKAIIECYVAR